MKNPDPRQLELFSDGARAVAAAKRPKPPRPTEADLQAGSMPRAAPGGPSCCA
jgi:hypothetical protein